MIVNPFRFLLLVVMLCLCACDHTKQYYGYLTKAYDNLENNHFEESFINASKAVKLRPDSSDGFLLRGRSLFELNREKESISDFRHVLASDPKNVSALYYIGLILYDFDQYDSSIYYINRAIAAKGGEQTYIEFNNEFSRYTFQKNIEMSALRYFRGLDFFYLEDYKSALEDFAFAANANFNKAKCFFYIGIISLSKGSNQYACKYLKLAIENGYDKAAKYLPKDCK